MAPPDSTQDRLSRFANLFVVVALVAMLIGAVLIIQAREVYVVDLEPGETAVLFDVRSPDWDPFGHTIKIVVHGPANVTLLVNTESGVPSNGMPPLAQDNATAPHGNDTAGASGGNVTIWVDELTGRSTVTEEESIALGFERATWTQPVGSGEHWVAEVENEWDEIVRVTATVSSTLSYTAGGILVGIGVLGFVSYRVGIRRD